MCKKTSNLVEDGFPKSDKQGLFSDVVRKCLALLTELSTNNDDDGGNDDDSDIVWQL